MGRIYYAMFDDLQVTNDANQDFWEIQAVTHKAILHGFQVTSESLVAENIDLRLVRRSTSGNGSAVLESQANQADAAQLAVVEQLALAPGTNTNFLMAFKWEQLGPLEFLPTPEMRIIIDPGTFLCLNINSALAGTIGWSGWICWEEV